MADIIPGFERRPTGDRTIDGKFPGVVGFLTPVFSEDVRGPDGVLRQNHAFTRVGYDKIRNGYACGNCLAEFVTVLVTCPVCGANIVDVGQPGKTPEDWQAYFDERNLSIDEVEQRAAEQLPATFDSFMERVMADPDIEQISVKSLMPSRAPGARRS